MDILHRFLSYLANVAHPNATIEKRISGLIVVVVVIASVVTLYQGLAG